ncbi:MAG TPA: hypothetical protein VEL28_00840 [Candidatus Binatia bacterium]|nr:hypothetical protein [Candidatus Binatia bacterium]
MTALRALLSAAMLLAAMPSAARACAVCFGDPASPLTKGADAGVLFLLGVVVVVLAMFASLFLYWMRRMRLNARNIESALQMNAQGMVNHG